MKKTKIILKMAVIGVHCMLPIFCQSGNENTACFDYISGEFSQHAPGQLPQPRTCKPNHPHEQYYGEEFYRSPAAYRQSSCCSNEGAYSIARLERKTFKDPVGWETLFPLLHTGNCKAQTEMMNLMICDPDQGVYVNEMNKTLLVCLSACQKWLDACGASSWYYDDSSTILKDAKEMCETLSEVRLGYTAREEGCYDQNGYPCDSQLKILVVDSDECLSAEDPSEGLINFYDSDDERGDYPTGCEEAEKEKKKEAEDPSEDLINYYDSDGERGDYPTGSEEAEKKKKKGRIVMISIISGSVLVTLFLAQALWSLYTKKKGNRTSNNEIKAEIAPTQSMNSTDALHPSEPQFALKSMKPPPMMPVPVPLHPLSVQPPAAKNVYKPVFRSKGQKPSFPITSPTMSLNTIEVSVFQPEPELSFIQKLDLRELGDQKSMGIINEDEYEKSKSKILDLA